MKRILLLMFFLSQSMVAQDYSDSWKGHFSYYNIQSIDYSNSKIYTAAENAIFIYDLNLNSSETISSIHGLSGNKISTLHYSETHHLLMIGYENGLIEIKRDGNENIFKVLDIVEKPTISPEDKAINKFFENNGKIFIATDYGISEYDLENLEFGDTFFIGENGEQLSVAQISIKNNIIYAATSGSGIKYANINDPNLVDYNQWNTIANGVWKGIAQVGDNLFAVGSSNTLYKIQGGSVMNVASGLGQVQEVSSFDGNLIITSTEGVLIFDQDGNEINSFTSLFNGETFSLNTSFFDGTNFFLGDSSKGLLMVNSASSAYEVLSPPGPLLNRISSMEATANQLWVVYDDYMLDYDPYNPISARGVSHLIEEEWHNFSSAQFFNLPELVNITINPNQTNEVYFSSYFRGLLKVVDEEPTILYNETNGLDVTVTASTDPSDVRINGAAFDTQGNLWMVNAQVSEGLKVLTPEGNIQGVDLTSVISDPADNNGFGELVIDENNNVFFGSSENGVIAYQTSTGELREIFDAEANLPSNDIKGMAVDQNNVLWIGTTRGLRVLYNPSAVFTQNVSTSPIIILEDDGVAQELLFEQFINDIEVDGANNKWISTSTSGVFYVSSNGQDILAHYTTGNSPLPSNDVADISIDHASGRVYFGTIDGLVSSKGTATQPQNNLNNVFAYPNPVRPGYKGNVVIDGLMQDSNVKITDISGNLVYEEISQGGSIVWDTTAFGKYEVASGVYLIIITSEDQVETKVAKIMIVR